MLTVPTLVSENTTVSCVCTLEPRRHDWSWHVPSGFRGIAVAHQRSYLVPFRELGSGEVDDSKQELPVGRVVPWTAWHCGAGTPVSVPPLHVADEKREQTHVVVCGLVDSLDW